MRVNAVVGVAMGKGAGSLSLTGGGLEVIEEAGSDLLHEFAAAGEDFGAGLALESESRQLIGLFHFQAADEVFDLGDDSGGGAEFGDADAQEQGGKDRVTGHFATNADPQPVLFGGVGRHFDEPDDGGMSGLVEVGDALVEAVDGQGVLDEVVGADAEEFDAAGEGFSGDGGGRDLDHGADFEVFLEAGAFLAELGFEFFDQGIGLIEFFDAGDHGVHELDVAFDAGAKDGAKLDAKDLAFLQTEADGAPAQERIHLLGHLQMGEELVPAQIERADDDGLRFEGGGDPAIGLNLFLFARERVAIDEEIFGAEQPDALGAAGDDAVGVGRLLDVGGEDDAGAVEGDGGLVDGGAEFFLQGDLFADQLAVFKQGLVGGINDDDPVVAVEESGGAGDEFLAGGMKADDGGDAEGTGHDGRMGGAPADVGGKAAHHFTIDLGGLGGGEIVADDDAGLFDLAQVEVRAASE